MANGKVDAFHVENCEKEQAISRKVIVVS